MFEENLSQEAYNLDLSDYEGSDEENRHRQLMEPLPAIPKNKLDLKKLRGIYTCFVSFVFKKYIKSD